MTRPAPGPPRSRRAQPPSTPRTGHRRAAPLRASWDPVGAAGPSPVHYRRRRTVAALAALLLVVTVVVVVGLVSSGGDDATPVAGTTAAAGVGTGVGTGVGEGPRIPAGTAVPSAELPDGGAFPVSGTGTFRVVPGTTPQVGEGKLYTYTVEVEDGTTVTEGDSAFATTVDATLDDPRSWVGSRQIAVRRVDAATLPPGTQPDLRVSLTSQLTAHAACGFQIRYETSCWLPDKGRVYINAARWVRGAKAFEGQMGLYRQYAINHEVGHAFGNSHVPCPAAGALAPVMMQETFGVSNDFLAQLTAEDPQGLQVPADGKVCRPNAWPYPVG